MNKQTPARANVVALKQILNLIPRGLINRHARETGVDAQARTFSVLSHLSAMLFAQLSHAMGLNDVCDWLRLKTPVLARFGVTPPARNTLFLSDFMPSHCIELAQPKRQHSDHSLAAGRLHAQPAVFENGSNLLPIDLRRSIG